MTQKITLDDLLNMTRRQVSEVFFAGSKIDLSALDNTQYRGIDLSLPGWMNKVLWKTFRKTFYRDPDTGILRGWNVRMEQTGWDGPGTPMMKNGEPITFGHYHALPAAGKKFPRNWQGDQYLDYSVAGNPVYDPARYTYSPLVAVNEGDMSLLIGWEVFRVAGIPLGIPDFWALRLEGPIEHIIPQPDQK